MKINKLLIRRFIIFAIIISACTTICEAQSARNPERRLFGRSLGRKREIKVKEPRTVNKAKKKQEAKLKKQKKDYALFVIKSQKRSVEIQTPEVQARMKQNKKDSDANYKTKKKKVSASTKDAGRKYKK